MGGEGELRYAYATNGAKQAALLHGMGGSSHTERAGEGIASCLRPPARPVALVRGGGEGRGKAHMMDAGSRHGGGRMRVVVFGADSADAANAWEAGGPMARERTPSKEKAHHTAGAGATGAPKQGVSLANHCHKCAAIGRVGAGWKRGKGRERERERQASSNPSIPHPAPTIHPPSPAKTRPRAARQSRPSFPRRGNPQRLVLCLKVISGRC